MVIGLALALIVALLFPFCLAMADWRDYWLQRCRGWTAAKVAKWLGMEYQRDAVGIINELADLPLIRLALLIGQISNVMWADTGYERLIVFDVDVRCLLRKLLALRSLTVVGFHSCWLTLPRIRISHERWYRRLRSVVTVAGANWPECPGFGGAISVEGDEAGIRRWMKPFFMEVIMEYPGYTIEGENHSMVIFKVRPGQLPPADAKTAVRQLLEEAYAIASAARRCSELTTTSRDVR